MKKIGLFIDCDNLYININRKFGGKYKVKLDYSKYIKKVENYGTLYRSVAYINQTIDQSISFVTVLKHLNLETKCRDEIYNNNVYSNNVYSSINKNYHPNRKISWNIPLAVDLFRIYNKLDVIMLGTSNNELIPLIQWIKENGMECITYASNITKDIRQACNNCIEITKDLLEEKKGNNE